MNQLSVSLVSDSFLIFSMFCGWDRDHLSLRSDISFAATQLHFLPLRIATPTTTNMSESMASGVLATTAALDQDKAAQLAAKALSQQAAENVVGPESKKNNKKKNKKKANDKSSAAAEATDSGDSKSRETTATAADCKDAEPAVLVIAFGGAERRTVDPEKLERLTYSVDAAAQTSAPAALSAAATAKASLGLFGPGDAKDAKDGPAQNDDDDFLAAKVKKELETMKAETLGKLVRSGGDVRKVVQSRLGAESGLSASAFQTDNRAVTLTIRAQFADADHSGDIPVPAGQHKDIPVAQNSTDAAAHVLAQNAGIKDPSSIRVRVLRARLRNVTNRLLHGGGATTVLLGVKEAGVRAHNASDADCWTGDFEHDAKIARRERWNPKYLALVVDPSKFTKEQAEKIAKAQADVKKIETALKLMEDDKAPANEVAAGVLREAHAKLSKEAEKVIAEVEAAAAKKQSSTKKQADKANSVPVPPSNLVFISRKNAERVDEVAEKLIDAQLAPRATDSKDKKQNRLDAVQPIARAEARRQVLPTVPFGISSTGEYLFASDAMDKSRASEAELEEMKKAASVFANTDLRLYQMIEFSRFVHEHNVPIDLAPAAWNKWLKDNAAIKAKYRKIKKRIPAFGRFYMSKPHLHNPSWGTNAVDPKGFEDKGVSFEADQKNWDKSKRDYLKDPIALVMTLNVRSLIHSMTHAAIREAKNADETVEQAMIRMGPANIQQNTEAASATFFDKEDGEVLVMERRGVYEMIKRLSAMASMNDTIVNLKDLFLRVEAVRTSKLPANVNQKGIPLDPYSDGTPRRAEFSASVELDAEVVDNRVTDEVIAATHAEVTAAVSARNESTIRHVSLVAADGAGNLHDLSNSAYQSAAAK